MEQSKCTKCGRTSTVVDMNNCPFCNCTPHREEKCKCLKKQFNHLRDEPCDICGKTYVDLAKEVIDKAVTPHREEHTEWEKGFDEVVGKDTLFVHKGKVIKFFRNLLTSHDTYWKEKVRKEVEEYKQFVLNVLDGVDIADGYCNTKAIRFALGSRTITNEDNLK